MLMSKLLQNMKEMAPVFGEFERVLEDLVCLTKLVLLRVIS
jgi:hypothetical protein